MIRLSHFNERYNLTTCSSEVTRWSQFDSS